jgi:site-specific DNA-adenine methylase
MEYRGITETVKPKQKEKTMKYNKAYTYHQDAELTAVMCTYINCTGNTAQRLVGGEYNDQLNRGEISEIAMETAFDMLNI